MKKNSITTYTLMHEYHLSCSTVHRLCHNMGVATQLIDDLCKILDCRVGDVMRCEKDK